MDRKVRKQQPPHSPGNPVRKKPLQTEGLLVFSFQYLDLTDPDFHPGLGGPGYLLALVERLRDFGSWRTVEFLVSRSSSVRCHPIEWEDTARPQGFAHLNQQLRDERAYQFALSSNEHGRVHGFVVDTTFYIAWLDPCHRLYPGVVGQFEPPL